MNIAPRIVFETKTARTGREAAEQFGNSEMWAGPRKVEFLNDTLFQFSDGFKTYAPEMIKGGFQIIVISEG